MILVAEIGINHNGDINIAKKLIDAAILGGCEFVKFQKRTIEKVYTKEELDKDRESPFGTTNRQQKEGLEFGKEEYDEIDRYCKEKGIGWFASPWDVDSVDFLMQYDCPFIKVASAMNSNIELLEKIKETGKKVIISTGMTFKEELDKVLELFGDQVKYILSCTSTYPTKIEDMNMMRIITLLAGYGCDATDKPYKIGFSNHSSGIGFITMAYVLGAEMAEYHITLDRTTYGSDQASSIELPGIMKIKDIVDSYEKSWGDGEIKCLDNEKPIKDKLRK